jgi:hypothetical protein
MGDTSRRDMYEHNKVLLASPPETLPVERKGLDRYFVPNVLFALFTTNHRDVPSAGRSAPSGFLDRCSRLDRADRTCKRLHQWYEDGGNAHVAAYLRRYDLSGFDRFAPPPKTAAFWYMVNAERRPEDAELSDAINALGNPIILSPDQVRAKAPARLAKWLDETSPRNIPKRFEEAGYVRLDNPNAKDGRWKLGCRKVTSTAGPARLPGSSWKP